ncbi:pirin-like C-terminal cupin domain-containing protein [Providencia rettgeri]|uniref:pirin-like C-terminal cupin domain-containing protein n=1 Tax=Providencia rettgeri TaxID=587 RepID=UPI00301A965D
MVSKGVYGETARQVLTLRSEFEYGIFAVSGSAIIEGQQIKSNELVYLGKNITEISIELASDSHILLLGGEPLNESVLMWWNFIGRTKADIHAAVEEWNQGNLRFGRVYNDEREPTPAPIMP